MLRAVLVTVLAVALLVPPPSAGAQQAKVPRVGVLGEAPPFLHDAFRQGLRELGYVEGQNIVIDVRSSNWDFERLPAMAAELVRTPVDVIVAANTRAIGAARGATSTIPIVFTVSGDPVGEGLVASLARPGGNVTGLATVSPDLVGKQLAMLKEVVPQLTRVAVLANPAQKSHPSAVRHARTAAVALKLQVHLVEARTPPEIDAAFAAMAIQRVHGLLVLRDAEFRAQRTRIAALAAKQRLPTMFGLREEAEAGGLIAYGASVPDLFRRAATYVDKILKGAKVADLPVEQPTRFELVINLKTARALGITVPPTLLAQADAVIE